MRTTTLPKLLIASDPAQFEEEIKKYVAEHPEFNNSIYKVYPDEGKTLSIEQIRELRKELLITSTPRLIIIYDFQTAKAEAQNALLKTLEDQTAYNQFFLCTNQIGSVLPTIISRCQIVDLISHETFTVDQEILNSIHMLFTTSGSAFLQDKNFQVSSLEDAKLLFHKVLVALQSQIKQGDRLACIAAQEALELSALLKSNNLNPQLTVDSWCLFVKKNARQSV